MIRGILVSLALILGTIASGAKAAPSMSFDGTRAEVELATELQFTPDELKQMTIELTLGNPPKSPTAGDALSLVSLQYGDLVEVIADLAGTAVAVRTNGQTISFGAGSAKPGAPIKLVIAPRAEGWTFTLNGTATKTLSPKSLSPTGHDPMLVTFGAQGLVATFTRIGIAREDQRDVELAEDGTLQTVWTPRHGTYSKVDGEVNEPEICRAGGTPIGYCSLAVTKLRRHGVYERERFFAIDEYNGTLVLIFDWGGYVEMRIDPNDPFTLVPRDPRNFWVGRLRFNKGTNEVFTAQDVKARPGVPFLENGEFYQFQPALQATVVTGPQAGSEIWVTEAFAPAFEFARKSCFDTTSMSLTDFTSQCGNALFGLPPPTGRNYTVTFNKVTPFGWIYVSDPKSGGGFISAMSESSADLDATLAGGNGQTFSLLGIEIGHNENTDVKRENGFKEGKTVAVHKFLATSHAFVLDPLKVQLHLCFLKTVLRAAPDTEPPDYYSDTERDQAGYNETGDRCNEAVSGPNLVPISDADLTTKFVGKFGTHFAHSMTLGAVGYATSYLDRTNIKTAISQNIDVSTSIKVDLLKTIKEVTAEDVPAPSGGVEKTSSKGKTVDVASLAEVSREAYTCVGSSSCNDGKVDAGERVVPAFLDLRPIDDLLAPPFYTDPKVTIELRAKVRRALDTYIATQRAKVAARTADLPTPLRIVQLELKARCKNTDAKLAKLICPEVCPAARSPRACPSTSMASTAPARRTTSIRPRRFRLRRP